jgi:hypothetical protein
MKTTAAVLGLVLVCAAVAPASANVPAASDAAPAAAAASTASTASATDANASQPQPRLICRRQETTGSRTGGDRICLTKQQWRTVYSGGSITTQKRAR